LSLNDLRRERSLKSLQQEERKDFLSKKEKNMNDKKNKIMEELQAITNFKKTVNRSVISGSNACDFF
jgi:hypothetical protein